ncbi:hypothetical protein Ahy_B04g069409 [Arachis hypogaea]|uniref:Uncharacterized protein n=1 Tax=Arachis hypogaea TaxID=3818 RepID=A0A444ZCI5_ARAHY|nr:hypothetical protein Ahy_B04g069409 [Arachis hypogaea]
MQVAMELEDDLFFADLSKEIALLIMEEEEEEEQDTLIITSPAESLQRESKGTGVFIPQATQPRRNKNRRGRSNNSYAKFQKHSQLDTTRMVVSQAPNKNSFKPSQK